MLVLSRKVGEWITLTLPDGRVVEVTVSSIDLNKVKIGVDAPRDIVVMRQELVGINDES